MKIKDVNINGNLFLAPMAGVTDFAFRSLARSFGASFSYTEMVSAKALLYDNKKTKDLLITLPNETPVGVQLFGHEPEAFKKVLIQEELQKFDIIDINMGCPAPKIVKNGDGSKLMTDFNTAQKVLKACVENTSKPVTVKMRLGYSKDVSEDFAKMLEDNGASALTVHGRLREEFYSGEANLEAIARVKQTVKIPVIGNGDVTSYSSAKFMMEYTGCDMIAVGRGALGNPWIFKKINSKNDSFSPSIEERIKIMDMHLSKLILYKGESCAMKEARKHLAWYTKGLTGAATIRKRIFEMKNYHDFSTICSALLETIKVL